MNNQVLRVRRTIPSEAPSDFRKHILDITRREVGHEIFKMLWNSKLPIVVDLEEKIYRDPFLYPFEGDVVEYAITTTQVRYRNVQIARMTDFDPNDFYKPNLQERITKWIKKKLKPLLSLQSRS